MSPTTACKATCFWVNDRSGSDFPFTFGSDTYNALGGHGHSIGSAFGDLDSDGHLDIFAGNFSHPGQPQTRVLLNQGPAGNYHFTDLGPSGIHWKESWSSPVLADFEQRWYAGRVLLGTQFLWQQQFAVSQYGQPGRPSVL